MKDKTFIKPLQERDYAEYDEWADWCSMNNYVIMDDNPEYFYCKSSDDILSEREKTAIQIDKLKQKLSATDYQAIKYAEGYLTEAEYTEMKAQRQSWRDEINRLEAELAGEVKP